MCSLWRLSEKVHITCTESAQNMLGVVVTGRPEGAGIQILVFWLLILWLLLCFHQRHWSVTIISFTVSSSWFLIITFLSWHMFWQVFPYRLLICDRCWQAGRGPPGLREEWVSAAGAANKGSVPLGSPAVAASLDLSWTVCSLSRGWNAGEAAKSCTQSGDCTLLQTVHPWKLPREAFSHGVSRSHSHEC